MPKSKAILHFDFGDDNGSKSFYSVQELQEWIEEERSWWQWLTEYTGVDGNINNVWRTINNNISQIKNVINQFSDEINDQQLQSLVQKLEQAYHATGLILKESPRGRYLQQLLDDGEGLQAGFATVLWSSGGGFPSTTVALDAAIRAVLFDVGVREAVDPEKRSLRAMRASWESVFGRQKEHWDEELQKRQVDFDTQGEEAAEFRTGLQRLLEKQVQDVGDQMESAHSKLLDIEATYDQKLALQKPVEYWQNQSSYHAKRSIGFGFLALVSGILVGGGLTVLLREILTERQTLEYWEVGGLAVIILLALWMLRIVVRIFLSHFHLKTDAAERAVMVNAYLALMRSGEALPEEDRALILGTLFRPSTLGIIKDDAIPPGVWEMITRSGGR